MSQKPGGKPNPSSSSAGGSGGSSARKNSDRERYEVSSGKKPVAEMPSQYNRVRVEDLLNSETSSSRSRPSGSGSRKKSSGSGSDSPPSASEIECNVVHCKRKFSSRDALRAHQKRSHPAPTAFVCEHCQSSFSTPPNLNKHVRTPLIRLHSLPSQLMTQ